MKATVTVQSPVVRTARVLQMEGLFDVPPSSRTELTWDVDLPLDERDWKIGLIVGPSGSGKTSVARALWPAEWEAYVEGTTIGQWDFTRSVLDSFPVDMPIKDIIEVINSVGFSSPPAWVRPYHVLSTGEQFRVGVARTLAEAVARARGGGGAREIIVLDEFTSVIDRTVAQVGSSAIAQAVRRYNDLSMVAVTCHYDVEDWLQPDWVYMPAVNSFEWRSSGTRPKSSSAFSAFIIPHGSSSSVITI